MRPEQVRQKVCGSKKPMGPSAARAAASRMRREQGVAFEAYHCPYGDRHEPGQWHVGHAISVEVMEALAVEIREGRTRREYWSNDMTEAELVERWNRGPS